MANDLIKVDTKELDQFAQKLQKASKIDLMKFLEECSKQLAIRLLRRTISKTPYITSNLRRRWTDHQSPLKAKAKNVTPEQWADTAQIVKRGKVYEITISNPTEYAPYVEYGHRKAGGHGWVPGKFMLTISIDEVERMAPAILQDLLMKFLKDLFK